MATSAVAVSKEIVANLDNLSVVRELQIQITGSVYLGTTDMYLRLHASRHKVKLTVNQGSFDDPLKDVHDMNPDSSPFAVVLVPFFDSIIPEFEARLNELNDTEINYLRTEFSERWRRVIEQVPAQSKVVILGLHSVFSNYPYGNSRARTVLDSFNDELQKLAAGRLGVILIDMQELITRIGLQNAVDLRMYFRSKNPFTGSFCEELSKVIIDSLAVDDRTVKVLALDCDNTIWGGVLGEDGFEGIQIDPNSYHGAIYHLVQRRFKELKELGLLLCLVSKNNEEDVLKVLKEHEHQLIRLPDLVGHRLNWEKKSSNINSLAMELNLGLASFVFIDDSEFECAEVKTNLPEVSVLKTPENISEYPEFLARLKQMCLAGRDETKTDKTSQYQARAEIITKQSESESDQEFFGSLNVRLITTVNQQADIPRLTEMFSKTNQFNATTNRRTAEEVKQLMADDEFDVVSIRVEDRFTNHGLTALIVMKKSEEAIRVTDWLISCRVLGRGIEKGLMAHLGEVALKSSKATVVIDFMDSGKNAQVVDFLTTLAPNLTNNTGLYSFDARTLINQTPSWITIES
jgi:FkbH-like protein